MKKLTVLFVFCLAFLFSGFAQTGERLWGVGFHGGFNQYNGDRGLGFYRFDNGTYGFFQISCSRYINRFLDGVLAVNYGKMGYSNAAGSFKYNMFLADLNLRLKFLGNDKCKFTPYVFVGLGYIGLANDENVVNNFARPVCGLGLTYRIAPVVSLQFQESFIFSDYDKADGRTGWLRYNDNYLQHSLGLVFNFGKGKDTDKDGVPDRMDKCPAVFGLAKFEGCPDSDNDGVVDSSDQCPNTPADVKVDAKGCPLDTDGDGVADYIDKCPDIQGVGKLEGCPDADNDGVTDADDKCPNTPANVNVDAKGCPIDTDGDGIADYLDKCPTVKGLQALEGCPDRDGDGITDQLDKCPDVKGTVENKGCPEIKQEVKDVFQKALQGIQFETGKDVIRPLSFPILNNVVKIMKENKEYNLIINGHTDNVGKPESNMILSQKRADAVKAYLIKNGVEAGRLKAFGFGDTKPVADNNTPDGRAKNRRVEFVVEF